jgi:LysR family pca operon transcriptional activator
VLARARRILAEVERIPADLALLKAGLVDSLVIGVLPSAATGLMPQVLSRFREAHKRTVVQLIEGRMQELLALLGAAKVDLVVGRLYEPSTTDSFIRDALFDEPLAILARYGHPLFNEPALSVTSVSAYPFILPTLEQRIGQDVEIALRDVGLRPEQPALRASSMSMIREVLLTSDSLTVLSGLTMVGDLVRGLVRVVPLAMTTAARPGGLVYRAGAAAPGVDAFRRVLLDYVDDAAALGHLRRLTA